MSKSKGQKKTATNLSNKSVVNQKQDKIPEVESMSTTINTNENKLYRVEVTGHSSPFSVIPVSSLRQSRQVHFIPFNKLFDEFQHFHKNGATIELVEPVNISAQSSDS